jgi:hypothetical protein
VPRPAGGQSTFECDLGHALGTNGMRGPASDDAQAGFGDYFGRSWEGVGAKMSGRGLRVGGGGEILDAGLV